jgi:ketosteroid isomerase-like protein
MRKLGLWFMATLFVAGVCGVGLRGSGPAKDEQQIRALEERFAAAFRAKDVDAIMKNYAPGTELFVFDVTPPRQHVGFEDYKKDWQDFFAAFGHVDTFEVQDLSIETDGKLAYSHSIQPVVMAVKDGSKFNLTVRVTDCYRKIDGKWLITQEHVSVPVDINTGRADLASKP